MSYDTRPVARESARNTWTNDWIDYRWSKRMDRADGVVTKVTCTWGCSRATVLMMINKEEEYEKVFKEWEDSEIHGQIRAISGRGITSIPGISTDKWPVPQAIKMDNRLRHRQRRTWRIRARTGPQMTPFSAISMANGLWHRYSIRSTNQRRTWRIGARTGPLRLRSSAISLTTACDTGIRFFAKQRPFLYSILSTNGDDVGV